MQTSQLQKLKAECKPDQDEFYKSMHPAIMELRSFVSKILNGGDE